MGKSSKRLKNRLQGLIDSKTVTITDIHKKTGIGRPSIYGYLEENESAVDLNNLDKIADALDANPWDLIKPENEPIVRPHTLHDCIEAVSNAALKISPPKQEVEIDEDKLIEMQIEQAVSTLSSFNEDQRANAAIFLRGLAGLPASSVSSRRKKAK